MVAATGARFVGTLVAAWLLLAIGLLMTVDAADESNPGGGKP